MSEIKVVKREHPIWNEKAHELLGHKIVGQWHYTYSVGENSISMITIYGYPITTKLNNWDNFQWEIHGYGMEDIERFNTKEEAEARCWELLLTPRGEEMP